MRRNRARDQLKPLLDRRLSVYTLAAAAGLGSATTAANAAVVYTSARQFGEGEIGRVALISLDLNHDGVADFTLTGILQSAFGTEFPLHTAFVYAEGRDNNRIAASGSLSGGPEAAALRLGQPIGKPLGFEGPDVGEVLAAILTVDGDSGTRVGNFYNQSNKFLGLKFSLNGRDCYGWARVNMKTAGNNFVFELVDYAYQDTPNKPILAGEGIPQANADLAQSLGLLAYGSDAIPAWRR